MARIRPHPVPLLVDFVELHLGGHYLSSSGRKTQDIHFPLTLLKV